MGELLTKELLNKKEAISDVFQTLVVEDAGLLSLIKIGDAVKNIEAGWIDDLLSRTEVTATAAAGTSLTVANADEFVAVGAELRNVKNADVFKATAVTSGAITVTPLDGSATPVSGIFVVNNVPLGTEASTQGAITKHQGAKKTQYTRIFRRDVELSNSVLESDTYDKASYIETQINAALFEMKNALAEAVYFGIKSKNDSDNTRSFDGIYSFFDKAGGTPIETTGSITYAKLSELAAAIAKAGGRPNVLVCNPAVGSALSDIIFQKQHLVIADNVIGANASYFKNPITGQNVRIVYDETCPTGDIWMLDSDALEIHPLGNRDLVISDATTPGKDATAMSLIKEVTLFIRNAKNRLGYITGLNY